MLLAVSISLPDTQSNFQLGRHVCQPSLSLIIRLVVLLTRNFGSFFGDAFEHAPSVFSACDRDGCRRYSTQWYPKSVLSLAKEDRNHR